MSNQNYLSKFSRGFTLVEILVVLAILTALSSLVISSFGKVGGSEALNTAVASTISVLNGAKSSAVSSNDASNYGVRIFNNKLISFKNNFGTQNQEFTMSNLVKISTSTGVGTDIIFNNVSGSTNASGTITISVINDLSQNSVINVYSTGIVEKK